MMFLLYVGLGALLAVALFLILIFYYRNRKTGASVTAIASVFFITVFSVGAYLSCNHLAAIQQWYAYGKRQYQFLTDYEKLGGINGMIKRINRHLAEEPNDFQGWVMLGKLHLAKLEYREAAEAFNQALQLEPNDREIKDYYELAKRS